ncbi:MAG: hypothetical protein IT320_08950 [Anaerolineae bacterium]|nr:hypothetical protein [Anaerolineae bacterium]
MKEKRSITGKQLILIGSVVITVVMLLSVLVVSPLVSGSSKGYNFLRQLFQGNEEAAQEYVSSGFLDTVRLNCTRGGLTGCLEDRVPAEWGTVGEIVLVSQAPQDEITSGELYHLDFDSLEAPVSVVLLMREQDGAREVVGWRGWVVSEGDAFDAALTNGERHDHELTSP